MRVAEAQARLIETEDSIVDIAMRVGFNSGSYFNKIFKKYCGVNPKDYRAIQKRDMSREPE